MDLAITLSREAVLPLHRQLYEELRRAILSGRLSPGQRLPSTRTLAKSLGISRITVAQSYEQLISEGYLQAVVGSGTFICTQLPDNLLHSMPPSARKMATPPIKLSKYGAGIAEIDMPEIVKPNTPISFRYGRPAFDQFPMQLWRKLLSRHCRSHLDWLDYATDPLGHRPLREAIARYLACSRAVDCEPDQILIVNGTQQAIDLITRLLVDPGETIALEEPSYLGVRQHPLLAQGAKLLPVPVDESGLIVEHLTKSTAHNIKLVYVTPSHQFPTGAVLSLARRLALLSWAQKTDAMIVEDDYDSEYRYEGQPIPALQGLDCSNVVLYTSSFSKVLFPALRIGYLVLPQQLVPVFTRAKWVADRQLPLLEQHVLADFIDGGHLESHIRRMRLYYDQRRQVLVQALNAHLGERATVLGENAGIHLMVRLQTNLSDEEIIQRASQLGVGIITAKPYYLKTAPTGEFIFGYSELTEQQLEEGICSLAHILAESDKHNNSYCCSR